MNSSATSPMAPEFENFLFASVGEERNGMLLSVLSALARMDIDPWQEADKLARLPVALATERLASFITSISDRSPAQQGPEAIAARLVKLLPHSSAQSRSRQPEHAIHSLANLQPAMWVVYAAIFLVFALGPRIMLGTRPSQVQSATAQVASSHTAAVPDAQSISP